VPWTTRCNSASPIKRRAHRLITTITVAGSFAESLIGGLAIRLDLVRDGSEVVLNWTGGQGPYQVQQPTNVGEPVPTNSMRLPFSPGNLFLRVRGQ